MAGGNAEGPFDEGESPRVGYRPKSDSAIQEVTTRSMSLPLPPPGPNPFPGACAPVWLPASEYTSDRAPPSNPRKEISDGSSISSFQQRLSFLEPITVSLLATATLAGQTNSYAPPRTPDGPAGSPRASGQTPPITPLERPNGRQQGVLSQPQEAAEVERRAAARGGRDADRHRARSQDVH